MNRAKRHARFMDPHLPQRETNRTRRTASRIQRAAELIQPSIRAAAFLDRELMPVIVTKDDGTEFITKTRSRPWALGHGAMVIQVDGIAGGYDCARVRPAMEVAPC